MPKRKSAPCDGNQPPIPLNSLDAALDLLVCDTFTKLEQIAAKFESCANVKLDDGVVRKRYEEAVKRYWVMKSMDELCCGAKKASAQHDGDAMDQDTQRQGKDQGGDPGRPLPERPHPGAIAVHRLAPDEEREWRRWNPKVGDVVLIDTECDGIWPGKIIDKKTFFQGRTVPRGNHFFPVRLYSEDMSPTITVKSRLIPLHLRPTPPLLASPALLSAYHHAASPTTFDMLATARESLSAHNRTHPGVGEETDRLQVKADKEAWNKVVNWVMNERRIEKLRAVNEERDKQLRSVIKPQDCLEGDGEAESRDGDCEGRREDEISTIFGCPTKRRKVISVFTADDSRSTSSDTPRSAGIFGAHGNTSSTPQRVASPSLASFIRPALSTPQRPSSPRRSGRDKRRSGIYIGMGEHSPRGQRGGTYTPPRILPSGDETAPRHSGSPVPTLQNFDFVSPLGPVRMGKLATGSSQDVVIPARLGAIGRAGSLEAVKEEEGEEDGWTLVQKKGRRRAGSLPLGEKNEMTLGESLHPGKEDDMMDL
ncbi:hypothetical protein IAU60_003966 [Kwoniella sp. DSM 27419]